MAGGRACNNACWQFAAAAGCSRLAGLQAGRQAGRPSLLAKAVEAHLLRRPRRLLLAGLGLGLGHAHGAGCGSQGVQKQAGEPR